MAPPRTTTLARKRFRITGVVQGVGFRPFVYNLASRLHLAGFVKNDAAGVVAEAEGREEDLARFAAALRAEAPPAARVEDVVVTDLTPCGESGFVIAESDAGTAATLVSPDLATCQACLAEIRDPRRRRYRYPFTNCTHCGPRFSIIQDVPYDRPATSMAAFKMCPACQREYDRPADRRFHAQPNACPLCGPRLSLWDGEGRAVAAADPLAETARLLSQGFIVAIKGIGGYHLACDAANAAAVATLRSRKYREEKPLAVMARDLPTARVYCRCDGAAARLLTSPRQPIVLLEKLDGCGLPEAVAPRNRHLGVMLPYTPLHHLLLREGPPVLVMTSGNRSEEPIAYRDDDVVEHLRGIADYYLTHDRPIARRVDDSVTRVFQGKEYILRRSRGYVPLPVLLDRPYGVSVLAVGGQQKNTFCLTRGREAFLSHHLGDMETVAAEEAFRTGVEDLSRLLGVRPAVVAADLHPDYFTSRYAERLGLPIVRIQHHHAHVASVLADAGRDQAVIGVAFDGAGWGEDGALWGGEVLLADRRRYRRAAHLRYVPLPGGDRASREGWRMALSWLYTTFGEEGLGLLPRPAETSAATFALVRQTLARGAGLKTSSMGRLFDAVAALAGVRSHSTYEGQAAVELEQLASVDEAGAYDFALGGEDPLVFDASPVIRRAYEDWERGVPASAVAGRFHRGVARVIVEIATRLRNRGAPDTVALGGGCFQNMRLLTLTHSLLRAAGFEVLIHSQVPTNDGGLSLGQAAIALAVAGSR